MQKNKIIFHFLICIFIICTTVQSQNVISFWTGAVTESSFTVKAKISSEYINTKLLYSTDSLFSEVFYSDSRTNDNSKNNIVTLKVSKLLPSQTYYFKFSLNNTIDSSKIGSCKTFSSTLDSFMIALGSCSWTGSNHPVFETIHQLDPLLFLHMGDMHYENIGTNDISRYRSAFNRVLASPTQSVLYANIPIAYIWDDHDYGPNNSDSTSPSREAARYTYREYVPHYSLVEPEIDKAIYHSFSIGRVKFIMCDSRSARSPASSLDNADKTMLGATQKKWFKEQLIDGRDNYALTVWVNSLPWIGVTGDDGWYLYTTERREIANFIALNKIHNLCMVSGDAHMIAIDDGTNSDYADSSGAGFPVLHAASLHRTPGVKGGPYSHGAYPGIGQFATMRVADKGDSISIFWEGLKYTNELIVSYDFTFPVSLADAGSVVLSIDTLFSYKQYPERENEIQIQIGNFNLPNSISTVDLFSLSINDIPVSSVSLLDSNSYFQDGYLELLISYDELLNNIMPFYNISQSKIFINGKYTDGSSWVRTKSIILDGDIIGDIDLNREINIADIMLLVKFMFLRSVEIDLTISDFNYDGFVDISDLVALVDYVFLGKN